MKSGIAVLGPSSKSMDPSFGRAKRAVVRSDASRPGSWLRSRESTRLREKERRRDGYGVWGLVRTRSRIRALRDDSEKNVRSPSVPIFTRRGESYFSLVSEASVSIFLITLHAPLSTVLNRTLDNALSPLLPTTYNAQPTAALTAREAELAR